MSIIFTREGLVRTGPPISDDAMMGTLPQRAKLSASNLLIGCLGCGHIGFSHDNWTECAECSCEEYDALD